MESGQLGSRRLLEEKQWGRREFCEQYEGACSANVAVKAADLTSFLWTKSLSVQIQMIKEVEADPKEARERTLHVSEVKDHALLYTKNLGEYNTDPGCRDLFHMSVSERAISFWRRRRT